MKEIPISSFVHHSQLGEDKKELGNSRSRSSGKMVKKGWKARMILVLPHGEFAPTWLGRTRYGAKPAATESNMEGKLSE